MIRVLVTPPADRAIDARAVESHLGPKKVAALKKFGAFVRRRMMSSLRYRNKKSAPGQPPSARRGKFTRIKVNKKTGAEKRQALSPLRELITFAVVDGGDAVIVGPMIFRASAVGGGKVPRLLEEGGSGTFLVDGRAKRGTWQPRPFASRAFKAELPGAVKLFGRSG